MALTSQIDAAAKQQKRAVGSDGISLETPVLSMPRHEDEEQKERRLATIRPTRPHPPHPEPHRPARNVRRGDHRLMTDVRAGQIWADNDKRSAGRTLRIVEVDETHAIAEEIAYSETTGRTRHLPNARQTRIRLDRFKPTSSGYRLLKDAKRL